MSVIVDSSFLIELVNSVSIDRIEFIAINNPEWAYKISQFINMFPEFNKYRHIASTTDKPINRKEDWMPITLFENVFYYVCISGVNYKYAIKQFKIIVSFLRSGDWITLNSTLYNFLINNEIQSKKRDIYWNIFVWMSKYSLTNTILQIEHIPYMKNEIFGLGDGFVAYMNTNFTDNDKCLEYTDINFIKGFKKVYGTDDITFIRNKCNEYLKNGFARVANSFMFQIYHYM